MSTISKQDKENIENVFNTLNNQTFLTLKTNKNLIENLNRIEPFISKVTYTSEVDLERGVSVFNPYLFQAWERLYLFKFLNEFDLIDSSSVASILFNKLTSALTNGTDASERFCRDTLSYRNGKIIEYIMEDLRSTKFKEYGNKEIYDNSIAEVAIDEFVILVNLLQSDNVAPKMIPIIEKEGIVEVIKHYIKSKNEHMRYWNVNIMGYLKNEEQLATIQAEEGLAFSMSFLKRMLDSNNCCVNNSIETMLFELLRCLSNLSEISQHQESLVRVGLIQNLSRIVRGNLVERRHWQPSEHNDEYCSFEKALAVKCLYSYAIHPEFSKIVLADKPLLNELLSLVKNFKANTEHEKLLKTEVQRIFMAFDVSITDDMRKKQDILINDLIQTIGNVKINVRNKICNERIETSIQKTTVSKPSAKATFTSTCTPAIKQSTAQPSQIPPIGHIFISYSHQNSKRVSQLGDMLKERGFPVWIDVEAIRGNTIDDIVIGLNDARVVIMCLSGSYRLSNFCKREAEYTMKIKKFFQPVIVEEGFRMEEDWLCFLVGMQNWIDLSGDLQFSANKAQFLDHVQHVFVYGTSSNVTSPSPASITTASNSFTAEPHTLGLEALRLTSGSPMGGQLPPLSVKVIPKAQINCWKIEQVLKWLDEEDLGDIKEKY